LKDENARANLKTLAAQLEALPGFNHHSIEETVRGLAAELAIKPGALMNPARVALTGQSVAPGLFDVMVLFGREKTVRRLQLSES